MCALTLQAKMNINTNMIAELETMISLQGSRVTHRFAPEPDDHDKTIEYKPKKDIKDEESVKTNRLFDAEMREMDELQAIEKQCKATRSEVDQNDLSYAHIIATFGENKVVGFREELVEYEKAQAAMKPKDIGSKRSLSDLGDIKNQQIFRKRCRMTDPMYRDALLTNSITPRDQECLDLTEPTHNPAMERATYGLVTAYGFSGPTDFATEVTMGEHREGVIFATLVEYNKVDIAPNKRGSPNRVKVGNFLQSASCIIETKWLLKPVRSSTKKKANVSTYKLVNRKQALSWGGPTKEKAENYLNWYRHVKDIDNGDFEDSCDDRDFGNDHVDSATRNRYDSDDEFGACNDDGDEGGFDSDWER